MSKDTILNPMALWGREMTTEEMHRLIEAAPYLLEALSDMLSVWRYTRETYGDMYGVGWDRSEAKASAAIAKVKGERE